MRLSIRFRIPATFWGDVAREASGFFGCVDQSRGEENDKGYCETALPFEIRLLTKEAQCFNF